jgi:hypothetical protein
MLEMTLIMLLFVTNLFWLSVVRAQRRALAEPRHVHMWGPWEKTSIGNWVGEQFVRTGTGQERFCVSCNARQIERVRVKQ